MPTHKCPHCAAEIDSEARLCRHCGHHVTVYESGTINVISVGAVLGNYRVGELIGQGGMGMVFRGRDLVLEKEVAIKVLPPGHITDQNAIKRFTREAQVTSHLMKHRNIVKTHYISTTPDGQPYFVMELLEGGNLESRLRAGPMPISEGVSILSQILDALGYAHEMNVYHRDMKPDNVMFDDFGAVVVTDFGLAHAMIGATALTTAGVLMGTPKYMSPEQCSDARIDGRSDIYSVGIIAYRMFTGRVPFDFESPTAILVGHLQQEPASPRSVNPGIPKKLNAVIMKAIEKDPGKRYQTAAEFAKALREAAETGGEFDFRRVRDFLAARVLPLLAVVTLVYGGSRAASFRRPGPPAPTPAAAPSPMTSPNHAQAASPHPVQAASQGQITGVTVDTSPTPRPGPVTGPPAVTANHLPVPGPPPGPANSMGGKVVKPDIGSMADRFGQTFVKVPPGQFTMGSPDGETGRFMNEGPVRAVNFDKGFFIQDREVSLETWASVMKSTPPGSFEGPGLPVHGVSWDEAAAFVAALNRASEGGRYRLPTEAEWEYACRAGTDTSFSFGSSFGDLGTYGVYWGNSHKAPATVGSLLPNPWGLFDMHGNVRELCADPYGPAPGSRAPGTAIDRDESLLSRVARGGSWRDYARSCRSAVRHEVLPGARSDLVGFRLVFVPKRAGE